MKILIEISRDDYDCLLPLVSEEPRMYSRLKNSMVILEADTMMTICEEDEAVRLLEIAKQRCPEAACSIEESIKNARDV
jgi:hypothetical protein